MQLGQKSGKELTGWQKNPASEHELSWSKTQDDGSTAAWTLGLQLRGSPRSSLQDLNMQVQGC